jgi:hypothetical protein
LAGGKRFALDFNVDGLMNTLFPEIGAQMLLQSGYVLSDNAVGFRNVGGAGQRPCQNRQRFVAHREFERLILFTVRSPYDVKTYHFFRKPRVGVRGRGRSDQRENKTGAKRQLPGFETVESHINPCLSMITTIIDKDGFAYTGLVINVFGNAG